MKRICLTGCVNLLCLFFGILVSWQAIVYAAPTISSVSAPILHNNSIIIRGQSFGTKALATPLVWDDLEDGKCDLTATIGRWSSVGSLGLSTSNQRHSNSKFNAMRNITTETEAAFTGGSDSPNWFVQYWFYLDNDWNWNSNINGNLGNIKIFRLWSTSNTAPVNLRIQFREMSSNYSNNDIVVEGADQNHVWNPVVSGYKYVDNVMGNGDPGWVDGGCIGWKRAANNVTLGTWHLMQFQFSDSSVGTPNGTLKWWFDGKLIFDRSDILTRTASDSTYKRPKYVGFYNSHGTGADGNDHFYIDDAYIDNTFARIELGNNQFYNLCTHREIQIPIAWSDTSITTTANTGSFQAGTTAYLFVVDAAGVTNAQGYPVLIGGGNLSPSAPSNLRNASQ